MHHHALNRRVSIKSEYEKSSSFSQFFSFIFPIHRLPCWETARSMTNSRKKTFLIQQVRSLNISINSPVHRPRWASYCIQRGYHEATEDIQRISLPSQWNLSLVRIHSRFPVSGRHCDVRPVRRARRRLHPQPRRPHNLRNLHGGQVPRDSQNHLHHDSFLCTFLHPQPSP